MTVHIERDEPHIAELVLDRPEALNAISTEQARTLGVACAELSTDLEVRAAVVSSTSAKAFCVGADLKERKSFSDDDLARQRPIFSAAFCAVLDLPMPTIAAVEGFALGGGFELALSCDLIVASDTAVFGLPEVGVGLIPGGGGTQLLPRRVGSSRAADLIMTGRQVDADEAYRLGVVDRRAKPGNARETALDLARQIAAMSPLSVREAKKALRQGVDTDLASGLVMEDRAWERVAFSDHRREGIAAFNEGRTAQWPGLPAE